MVSIPMSLAKSKVFRPSMPTTPKFTSLTPESASFFLIVLSLLSRQSVAEPGRDFLGDLLSGKGLDVMQPQAGGLVDGLEEGAIIERPGLASQSPAELLGAAMFVREMWDFRSGGNSAQPGKAKSCS